MEKLQVSVKVLLTDGNGRFLLLKRSRDMYPEVTNPWDIVGGCIDPGKGLLENLQQEVHEETGLFVEGSPVLVAAQDILSSEGVRVIRLTYVARTAGTGVSLSDEHVAYKWLTLGEIAAMDNVDDYFIQVFSDIRDTLTRTERASSFTSNITNNNTPVRSRSGAERESAKRKPAQNVRCNRLDEKIVKSVRGPRYRRRQHVTVGKEISRKMIGQSTEAIGAAGENLACRYLKDRGFAVRERNYRKKWGEIDIVAEKSGLLHFVEVKAGNAISRGTGYRPEIHVHSRKIERLHRTIQTYIAERRVRDREWQLDVLAVDIDTNKKEARCRFIENVI